MRWLQIWDQHASPVQLCYLALGLAGGAMFQQAPLRKDWQAAASLSKSGKLPLASQDAHAAVSVLGGARASERV